MPSDINGEVPPWLAKNWTPREPFDPTPWLQERYRRQVQQAKLPLELQQMELQNAQARTAIEAQGMQNELHGIQLQQYQQELPELGKLMAETGGDPKKLLSMPIRTFNSPQIQKQYLDTLHAAAGTEQELLRKERMLGQIKLENEIIGRGGKLPPVLEDGTRDPDALSAEMNNVIAKEQANKVALVNAHYGAPVSWETKVVDGVTFLANTRTGATHMVPRGITKQEFIAKNVTRWMQSENVNADEAGQMLSDFYDKKIAVGQQPATAPPADVGNDPGNIRSYLK